MNSGRDNLARALREPEPLQDWQVQLIGDLRGKFNDLLTLMDRSVPSAVGFDDACDHLAQAMTLLEACVRCGRSVVTPARLANVFAGVERRNLRVARIWMNACDYADVRKLGSDVFDQNSDVVTMRQGVMGWMWGAEFRVTRDVPEGFVAPIADSIGDPDLQPGWKPQVGDLVRL